MPTYQPEVEAHREWLGQIQQTGLVVSAQVLVNNNIFIDRNRSVDLQIKLRELLVGDDAQIIHFARLTRELLEWPEDLLVGWADSAVPAGLSVALPEYDDTLAPKYAIRLPAGSTPGTDGTNSGWLALIVEVPSEADLDRVPGEASGWRASPHARLERLLRETSVPIGLLFNSTSVRLVYAPRGESSGYLTFRFEHLAETLGRPMVGALRALLGVERVTDVSLPEQRLPSLLSESRKYQNTVSTELAGQVLEALWELVRGFQRANQDAKGALLGTVLREKPADVYGGLLTTMMRLVFLLYAEDRGLMPAANVYQSHYSVSGLFERLREDQARNPDTMDARYGAWAQLLVLFRLIHDGAVHGDLKFPKRHGRLFDPDVYPFLEGRPHGSHRQLGEVIELPKISDGVVFRVLHNLLMLDGERLSYRTLDVEQIGSVYEAMMGFALEEAHGASIAVAPKHVVVNLEELLEQPAKSRSAWLKERTELKLTGNALAQATTPDEVIAALGKRVSPYTPRPLTLGDLYLQPTEERRRSGSHYTPRTLTAPIVETTLRPIFERIGVNATPEQVLGLKVCDPAMGSGAFLVEACRLLGERLQKAWEAHGTTPAVPADEDQTTFARRLVAERCLYGVDKNIFAVDLAKLSLWLATLARDHPFTFLDHSLRHGDSLVGLSREQIASLHWAPKQLPLIRSFIDTRVGEAQKIRIEIEGMGASDDVPEKARLLREADETLADVRLMGDAVVSAFFSADKPRAREMRRVALARHIEAALRSESGRMLEPSATSELQDTSAALRETDHSVPAFHWAIEFPEVFARENAGFDAVIGNPPFMGGMLISTRLSPNYLDWLIDRFPSAGNRCDLVAYFYRRMFCYLRNAGCFGMIGTNTVSQGDTRAGGLGEIVKHGGVIFSARKRLMWPGNAAVVVSVVHVSKRADVRPRTLDGVTVDAVSSYLLPNALEAEPQQLRERQNQSFIGTNVLGMGFTFDDENEDATPTHVMHRLIASNQKYAAVIKPFIGGEEVNQDSRHRYHRYIIDFGELPLEKVEAEYPGLLEIVRSKVKPQRDAVKRAAYRRHWWMFAERQSALYETIKPLNKVLVSCQVSSQPSFAFLPTNYVYAHTLTVFVSDDYAFFALLQTRVHEIWARVFGSSMKDDLRYTPTDCFETFPFPSDWPAARIVRSVGEEYYTHRETLMAQLDEGLTAIYNRFHNPTENDSRITRLRELHAALDRAVLDAYGWSDIRPVCRFLLDYEDDAEETPGKAGAKRKPWRYRWPDDLRDEVLGRLLALNARRAAEEQPHVSSRMPASKTPKQRGRRKGVGALLD